MAARGIPTAVQVLLINEAGEILFQQRAPGTYFAGFWSLPGGHVEAGEALETAAVRELAEELGIAAHPADLVPLAVIHRASDTNRIEFLFTLREWRGVPRCCEPDRATALAWYPATSAPEPLVPYLAAVWPHLGHRWYFEVGWDCCNAAHLVRPFS